MNDFDSSSSAVNNATWHRVSPIAICYFLIQNIQHALNFWPVLVGALANQNSRLWLISVGIPVLIFIVLGFSLLRYWVFRYQFDGEKIQIRSGIFQKRRLILHFDRVQEANLEQAIYFRPFGLWTLRLESAGSTKEEIALPGVNEKLAADIKQLVLSSKNNAVNPAQILIADVNDGYVIQHSLLDLIRYGLMHNTLIYFVAILAPLLTQNDVLWRTLANLVENMGLRQWVMGYLSAHSLWVDIILVSMLSISIIAVIYSLSIALAVVKYWNYTLRVQDERLQYEAGLFNRVACGFRQHKLQTVIIKQSFIARLLKRYSLEIRQTNEIAKQGAPAQGFIIPVLTQTQLDMLMDILRIDKPQWQRTLAVQIFWRTLFWGGALTVIAMVAVILFSKFPIWLIVLPLPAVGLLCWKYWYSQYYSLTENDFAIKRGLLGYSIVCVPQIKVQKLLLAQGPLARLHNCAKMQLWSGATHEVIDYVELAQLQYCRERILHTLARYRGRWM